MPANGKIAWSPALLVESSPWRSKRRGANGTDLTQSNQRRQALDRYRQHTQLCHSCRTALKRIQQVQVGLVIYFILVLAVVVLLGDGDRLTLGLPLMVSALLGLGLSGWLRFFLEPQFHVVDYVHAERS